MIRTFKNRALKKLYEKGDPSKIKADHVERVEDILFRLDNAMKPSEMDLPGWNLHKYWGFSHHGEAVADEYYAAFFDRLEQVAEQPLLYPPAENIRQGYRLSASQLATMTGQAIPFTGRWVQ